MQTYRQGSEPFSLQRRNIQGGTKPLEGWGFRNETDPLTDVLLGSPAHLRHLSTSSLSRKHLREAPCNVQVGQAQHAELDLLMSISGSRCICTLRRLNCLCRFTPATARS